MVRQGMLRRCVRNLLLSVFSQQARRVRAGHADMTKIRELDERLKKAREARARPLSTAASLTFACLAYTDVLHLPPSALCGPLSPIHIQLFTTSGVDPVPVFLTHRCKQRSRRWRTGSILSGSARRTRRRCAAPARRVKTPRSVRTLQSVDAFSIPTLSPQRIKAAEDLEKRAVKMGLRPHLGGHRLGGGEGSGSRIRVGDTQVRMDCCGRMAGFVGKGATVLRSARSVNRPCQPRSWFLYAAGGDGHP